MQRKETALEQISEANAAVYAAAFIPLPVSRACTGAFPRASRVADFYVMKEIKIRK
jgi:hypothetical protein